MSAKTENWWPQRELESNEREIENGDNRARRRGGGESVSKAQRGGRGVGFGEQSAAARRGARCAL